MDYYNQKTYAKMDQNIFYIRIHGFIENKHENKKNMSLFSNKLNSLKVKEKTK